MYGPLASFVYMWTYLLGVRCPANTLKVIILSRSILTLVFPDCPIPTSAASLLAIVVQGGWTVWSTLGGHCSTRLVDSLIQHWWILGQRWLNIVIQGRCCDQWQIGFVLPDGWALVCNIRMADIIRRMNGNVVINGWIMDWLTIVIRNMWVIMGKI